MKHRQKQQVARTLAAATGAAAANLLRAELHNAQLQAIHEGMEGVGVALQRIAALQMNMVARLVADYRALAAAMAEKGITPDPEVFQRELQAFKAERGPGFMPEIWSEAPDWLERMRNGPAAGR